jgi:DNA helicase II / ATP-dependent DNA helicase PcrA
METLKIYGPPGTGKTTRMLELFEQELKTVKPTRVGFMTFTRSARIEALSRASLTEDDLPFVKTIHAVCYRMLAVSQDQMIRPKQLKEFGKSIGVELSGTNPDNFSLDALTALQQATKADRLLQLNHLGRHRRINLKEAMKDAPTDIDWHFAKWFTESYRQWKTSQGLYDYTDLLTAYLEQGGPLSIDVLFIDEAQDLSLLQWEVIRKLGAYVKRRFMAGDDDQAIFTWAGASPELFNNEPCDRSETLPRSYRLPRAVHEVSQRIIQRVRRRHPKDFQPRDEVGEYRAVGYLTHDLLGDRSSFVLYRNHHRGRVLAEALESLAWPFDGALSPLGQFNVRPALACLQKFRDGKTATAAEAKAFVEFATPGILASGAARSVQRGEIPVGLVTKRDLTKMSLAQTLSKLPKLDYMDAIVRTAGLSNLLNPSVHLMSIHQSKGQQAETVIMDLEMATRTYDGYLKDPDSEHRVFYVGATRARSRLLTLLPTDVSAYQL